LCNNVGNRKKVANPRFGGSLAERPAGEIGKCPRFERNTALRLAFPEEPPMTVKLFTPPTLPKRGGYSQVCEVSSGKLILIAGQVPHDVKDQMVGEGDFEAQVEQVFKNLDAALKAAGGSMKNLVKIMNYCVGSVSYEERMV